MHAPEGNVGLPEGQMGNSASHTNLAPDVS